MKKRRFHPLVIGFMERISSTAFEELNEALVAANLQRAIRLRQAILQRAFKGELVSA
jgi:hypothetical protein